jgi:hypothetical protein
MLLALGVLLLAGCQQVAAPTATPSPTPRAPVSKITSTPFATATPAAPPTLVLVKVGAAASPSGFIALAVINNPSGETATDVVVELDALNAAGQIMTRRVGRLPRIAPQSREAVALNFPVGRTLPAQFSGRITSVGWSSNTSGDLAQVANASFIQDARTPSVRIHVVNHGQGPARVELIAVCWDDSGNIRGGGIRFVVVGPDAQGRDITVDVSIATTPERCDGYGVLPS